MAILCITALEVVALLRGIDGTIFGLALTIIGGIGGYHTKTFRDKAKEARACNESTGSSELTK